MSACQDYKIGFTTFHNVINNELTSTPAKRHTVNPNTEEPLWELPVSSQREVNLAVDAAKAAFPSWSKLSQDERARYLNKLADAIEANHESFGNLIRQETAKTAQIVQVEMGLAMGLARETPKLRLREEKLIDDGERTAIVRHVPLGVGVGLVPWNFPLALGIGKCFAALLAGCTFIWKPSPYSPYTALKVAELGARILPPGVLQALSGEEDIGPMLTAHPDVAKISFTGSVETGKKVFAACADTLKRVTLELGGNDAAIICEDVDINSVAAKISSLAFIHSGQICMNVKRIYVHEQIYDKFLAALIKNTKQLNIGDTADPKTTLGPVQNRMQYKKLQKLYAMSASNGCKTAYAGEVSNKSGFFMAPTIIDNPPDDSAVVVEEPFGPIVPVMRWSDEEDVIKRANDSKLGLGASVWSKDVTRAKAIVERLEAGNLWVNTAFELDPRVPFGGHKESGVGVEWGALALQGWCNPQALWTRHT
ncbi:aldehyde dehydrogenase [Xylariaceae sp. FL1019]|nr:aldehyde dehydrogenase [Xylariaceae sp. FL1019]